MISIARYRHLIRTLLFLLQSGQYGEIGRRFRERIYDDTSMVGMRLDLTSFEGDPANPENLTIRPVRSGEVPSILDFREWGITGAERHDRILRSLMLQEGIQTCYVAEDSRGDPCFIQWLIWPDQNQKLERYLGGWYPLLSPDEVLIEYAYTAPDRRGRGIMPAATSCILAEAREGGARTAITFIPAGNKGSLRIHLRMGFTPFLLHVEKRRLLVR
ncbi:MAG: GNAT family N-acetyltransferase, partial [Bacteroidetes bacterium]|nr:GNAT family N-acetyltransferase [Bacteroidota bacterium]